MIPLFNKNVLENTPWRAYSGQTFFIRTPAHEVNYAGTSRRFSSSFRNHHDIILNQVKPLLFQLITHTSPQQELVETGRAFFFRVYCIQVTDATRNWRVSKQLKNVKSKDLYSPLSGTVQCSPPLLTFLGFIQHASHLL